MRKQLTTITAVGGAALVLYAVVQAAAERAAAAEPMTAERLGKLIQRVDEKAMENANIWEFTVEDHRVTVVYDENADRMRIVVPITSIEVLEEKHFLRLLQANFDSALDARYAVAQDVLWATFIHPLSPLSDRQFLTGLAETINIVNTYGTSYSSGMFVFGGGDSGDLQLRKLIEKLQNLDTST